MEIQTLTRLYADKNIVKGFLQAMSAAREFAAVIISTPNL
jgi:hypothetical protein